MRHRSFDRIDWLLLVIFLCSLGNLVIEMSSFVARASRLDYLRANCEVVPTQPGVACYVCDGAPMECL